MENDVRQFIEWLISVGCPTNLIPSENKIKKTNRAQMLPLKDIKERFKAATEVQIIRQKNLRVDLCKIKKWNFLIADKREISWEYWQYDKLNSTRRDIKRMENTIEELKSDYECTMQQLAVKDALKQKQKGKVKENITKMHLHEVNYLTLSDQIKDVMKSLDDCDYAMSPLPSSKDVYNGTVPVKQLSTRLEKYYTESMANEEKSENEEDFKTVLWTDISEILKGYPNSVICIEILQKLKSLMGSTKSILEENRKILSKKKNPLREYNIGLNDFLVNRLRLLIHIKYYNAKLEAATKNYISDYNTFQVTLSNKIYHFSPQYILNYLKTLVLNAVYQGKIALLESEYNKYQNCSLEDWITLQHEKVVKDVRDSREKFLSEVKNVETSIAISKQTPLKLKNVVRLLRSQIVGLKKQIAHDDKKKDSIRTLRANRCIVDATFQKCPAGSDELEDGNENLVMIEKIPPPDDLDISLPITEGDCKNFAQNILRSEVSIKNILSQTEILGTQIGDLLNDGQRCCDFLIDNPMRNYVPPEKKVNGHTYKEYETEFMLHYRQIAESE
ncbi:uncharacterized protein LOC129801497 [Phlebotomus papatasi]|uniref:uncharacterized protein LOC129801497 n=1 Tax=Phlebotomus papatasi TaxID=29031 RepID=UPI0024838420|nr:uncharacterized protein LOC129801497 [Phlebotomus papatasi]